MVRVTDYDSRRKEILSATIHFYIKKATPISSELLAQRFDFSSATIRNVLAELEDMGYLIHTHTSSGRVPTDKGYRYYVDFLLSQKEPTEREKRTIRGEYHQSLGLDELLEKTAKVLSQFTHQPGISTKCISSDTLYLKGLSLIFEQPEFQDIKKARKIFEILEERDKLWEIIYRDVEEDIKVYIGKELGYPQIEACSMIVSSIGKESLKGRLAILGPQRMDYDYFIPMLKFISGVVDEIWRE